MNNLRPFLVGTMPSPMARPQTNNGVEPEPTPPISIPLYVLVGSAMGAINGAVLLWQVSWSQEQPNVSKHMGRGAVFGVGAINGLLLGLLAQQQT